MIVKWRRFILLLILAGTIVYFNAHIDDYFDIKAEKIAAEFQQALLKVDVPQGEIKELQYSLDLMRQETTAMADVWGSFYLVLLLIIGPFLLLEKEKDKSK